MNFSSATNCCLASGGSMWVNQALPSIDGDKQFAAKFIAVE